MTQEAVNIWPTLLAALLSAVAMYIGFINKMRTQISVLEEKVAKLEEKCDDVSKTMEQMAHINTIQEEKVKRLEIRQDSHSKKNDDVISLITELKIEMIKKVGDVLNQVGRIQSDVENINNTIAVFDDCVVSRKKSKKE